MRVIDGNKRLLGVKELFYLSLGSFGLQFASGLEMGNTSGLFKFLGASDKDISWLWLIAPITGLLIQPVLGQLSDLINTKFGKRVPFIFLGAFFASISLLLSALSESLTVIAILILVLSCSLNAATEGMRALIGDITPKDQKPTAFAWQAVLGGLGAMIASLIPWLFDRMAIFVRPEIAGLKVPVVIKVSFFLGSFILWQTIWLMLTKIKESDYNPVTNKLTNCQRTSIWSLTISIWFFLFRNLLNMPQVIKRFFLVQIFTWAGIFCIWLYFGIALAQHIFNLPLDANLDNDQSSQMLMQKGILEAGICFGLYQLFGMLYALILPQLSKLVSPYKLHAYSLFCGAFCLLIITLAHQMWLVYLMMVGVGIFWGSVAVMPYAIVAAELPKGKVGTYFGLFNITITIPQIFCGLTIGYVNETIFKNHAIFSILLAGVLVAVAGLILLRQQDSDLFKKLYYGLNKFFYKIRRLRIIGLK